MSLFIYIFVVFFTGILLEVGLGSMGLLIPLTAILVFYLAAVHGWELTVFFAATCGIVLDTLYGRPWLLTPISLAAVCVMSFYWSAGKTSKNAFSTMLPGGAVALTAVFPQLLVSTFTLQNPGEASVLAAELLLAIAAGTLFTPIAILILDYMSLSLGYETFLDLSRRKIKT